jgi:hypothetical protein
LLLKLDSTSTGYEKSTFRSSGDGKYGYYDGNFTLQPIEYADSTLQRTIQGIANALPVKEQAVIQARTSADLRNNEGTPWVPMDPQKLWALSYDEWSAVKGDATFFTGKSDYNSGFFWLRSPFPSYDYYSLSGVSGGGDHIFVDYVYAYSLGVRPAFDLDLTNVAGYATLDSGYKFTFADESLNIGGINGDGTLDLTDANTLLASLNGTDYTLTSDSGLFDLNTLGFSGLSDGEYELLLTAYELNDNLFSDFVGSEFSQTVRIQDGALLFDAPPRDNAAPEPATLLIFGLGLAGLGLARRRKK